jgi:hypothetical protein
LEDHDPQVLHKAFLDQDKSFAQQDTEHFKDLLDHKGCSHGGEGSGDAEGPGRSSDSSHCDLIKGSGVLAGLVGVETEKGLLDRSREGVAIGSLVSLIVGVLTVRAVGETGVESLLSVGLVPDALVLIVLFEVRGTGVKVGGISGRRGVDVEFDVLVPIVNEGYVLLLQTIKVRKVLLVAEGVTVRSFIAFRDVVVFGKEENVIEDH